MFYSFSFWGTVLKEINDTQNYMQTSSLNIHQNEMKMADFKAFLVHKRKLIENSIKYTKEVCDDLSRKTELWVWKKTRMAGEKNKMFLNFWSGKVNRCVCLNH